MAQFKLNSTQGLAVEIKLRGTPQFDFHTIFTQNKSNSNSNKQGRFNLNPINSKYSHTSDTLSLIILEIFNY